VAVDDRQPLDAGPTERLGNVGHHLRALEIAAGLVIGVPFLLKGLAIV
jgi:hypothetical protein